MWAPGVEDIYPIGFDTTVNVGAVAEPLEGAARPGHFVGVATVVTILLSVVGAERAYFGQKDAQQLAVIQRMVADLNFDIEIVPMPTVRESDGLAMSSRNRYLSPEARRAATVLYRSLQLAKERIEDGERTSAKIIDAMRELIEREKPARIDYIELVDTNRLEPQELVHGEMLIALAVFIGQTRLIDNLRMRVPD